MLTSRGGARPRPGPRGAGITECLTKPVLSGVLRERAAAPPRRRSAAAGRRGPRRPPTARRGRRRVLVVEDNPVNQMVADRPARVASATPPTTADDGLDALEVLRARGVRRRADGRADAADGRLRRHPGDPCPRGRRHPDAGDRDDRGRRRGRAGALPGRRHGRLPDQARRPRRAGRGPRRLAGRRAPADATDRRAPTVPRPASRERRRWTASTWSGSTSCATSTPATPPTSTGRSATS